MLWNIIMWFLNGHTGISALDYQMMLLFAFLGTSVTVFATNPRLKLPRMVNGELDPGVFGMYVIGLASAVAIGHKIPVPFLVGMLAPVIIPFLLKSTIPLLLRTLNPIAVVLLQTATKTGTVEQKETKVNESGTTTPPDTRAS